MQVASISIVLATGFAGFSHSSGSTALTRWKHGRLAGLEERFQLLYLNHFKLRYPDRIDGDLDKVAEGEEPFSVQRAFFLNEIGFLQPPMFEEKGFVSFRKIATRASVKSADILSVAVNSGAQIGLRGFWHIAGWEDR